VPHVVLYFSSTYSSCQIVVLNIFTEITEIGLYNFLQKRKDAGTLKDLAQEDGEIHCVFVCCDLPYQYLDDYFVKLGEDYFHPIQNSVSPSPAYSQS
jgi:hypothetical protein